MKLLIRILTFFSLSQQAFGQSADRDFGEILQTYYLHKDKDVVEKTIDFVNHTSMDYEQLEPILTGFYGALFAQDAIVKTAFASQITKITKPGIRQLLVRLSSINVDKMYSKLAISPAYNDMNWSSCFATGDTRYIANIVSNIHYSENRKDINLFLAGASAKWSLCSNARQDNGVKKYLNIIKKDNKDINQILQNEPQLFKEEMINVVSEQRQKGIWK